MKLALRLGLLAALVSVATAQTSPTTRTVPTRHRVLIVDIDDMGYDLLRDTPTPTLDWLGAHGRVFQSFTTAPTCTPSRAMMNLGAYGSHEDVLVGGNFAPDSTLAPSFSGLIPLARHISNAGLRTSKVGKWHLCGNAFHSHPNDLGWSDYRGAMGNLRASGGSYFSYVKVTNGSAPLFPVTTYCTTEETNDAIDRVMEGYELISLSYHAPHKPFHVPPPHLHTISPVITDRSMARAMLQACDHELGRLLREALPRGYTVLVYGDNGTSTVLGGEKGSLREGGILVPFVAIGPGVEPGVEQNQASVVDIYATVADWLNVPRDPATQGPDSRSFARALRGSGEYRRWSYSEAFDRIGEDPSLGLSRWRRAVRGGRYKLIVDTQDDLEQLYDLTLDPGEANDLLLAPALEPEAIAALRYFRLILARL